MCTGPLPQYKSHIQFAWSNTEWMPGSTRIFRPLAHVQAIRNCYVKNVHDRRAKIVNIHLKKKEKM